MENTSPATTTTTAGHVRVWLRRVLTGAACAPLVVISLLHTMGRSDDFGVLGEWYVMLPLTIAACLAWLLVEKTATWATRPTGTDSDA